MSSIRVAAYVDGFNFYHGLIQAKLHTSRWLDLRAMCSSLLRQDQQLVHIRYFTSRIRNDPAKRGRQRTYIDALEAHGGVEVDYGHFLPYLANCRSCGHNWRTYQEKMTDVNIVVRLMDDAYDDLFDTAVVISADGDLVPLIKSVRGRYPTKRIVVAFPPRRHSVELARAAHSSFLIGHRIIRASRLPDPVVQADGHRLRAPKGWLPNA